MDEPLQVIPVTAERAPAVWSYVRERLSQTESEIGQVALPERVYGEWSAGRAFVLTIHWEGRLSGVVVLTGPEISDSMKKMLWVWVLAVDRVAPAAMRHAINDWLAQAARNVGASSVAMASPREGWGRYLKSLGWKAVEVQYELEVSNG